MTHEILFDAEVPVPEGLEAHLTSVISKTLELQGIEYPCEISILLTDDAGIHEINLDQRGIDRPTDVLSFPMFELEAGTPPTEEEIDPATDMIPLGDIVLSLERAEAQAQEFGHSVLREFSYLTVHSILHLLGYDHMDEGEMKAEMRHCEEMILEVLGISRT